MANANSIVSYPHHESETTITEAPKILIDLPGLPLDHHGTKNVILNYEGSKLCVSVGLNSNIGENGVNIEEGRVAYRLS